MSMLSLSQDFPRQTLRLWRSSMTFLQFIRWADHSGGSQAESDADPPCVNAPSLQVIVYCQLPGTTLHDRLV